MTKAMLCGIPLCFLALIPSCDAPLSHQGVDTTLRFEVSVASGLLAAPRDGRLLVVLGKQPSPEPRFTIGNTGMKTPPVLGADVNGLAPGVTGVIDETAEIFPIESLRRLPPGDYYAQAM